MKLPKNFQRKISISNHSSALTFDKPVEKLRNGSSLLSVYPHNSTLSEVETQHFNLDSLTRRPCGNESSETTDQHLEIVQLDKHDPMENGEDPKEHQYAHRKKMVKALSHYKYGMNKYAKKEVLKIAESTSTSSQYARGKGRGKYICLECGLRTKKVLMIF